MKPKTPREVASRHSLSYNDYKASLHFVSAIVPNSWPLHHSHALSESYVKEQYACRLSPYRLPVCSKTAILQT